MSRRHNELEVKRIVLLSCVRPIIEYGAGAEVWIPTCQQESKGDSMQKDILETCMRMDNPCNKAVAAEHWGLKPLEVVHHPMMHSKAVRYSSHLADCRPPQECIVPHKRCTITKCH